MCNIAPLTDDLMNDPQVRKVSHANFIDTDTLFIA